MIGAGMTERRTARSFAGPVGSAFAFVMTKGVVNLFADMTYEGGTALNGQFLASLGAGAAAVSIIAGVGEFLGYSLRSVSGYFADRTGRYWWFTFAGYAINLLAVPAMALAGSWPVAAAFGYADGEKIPLELTLDNVASDSSRSSDFAFEDEAALTLGTAIAIYTGEESRPTEIFPYPAA